MLLFSEFIPIKALGGKGGRVVAQFLTSWVEKSLNTEVELPMLPLRGPKVVMHNVVIITFVCVLWGK